MSTYFFKKIHNFYFSLFSTFFDPLTAIKRQIFLLILYKFTIFSGGSITVYKGGSTQDSEETYFFAVQHHSAKGISGLPSEVAFFKLITKSVTLY